MPPKKTTARISDTLVMEIATLRKMVNRAVDGSPICCAFECGSDFFEIGFFFTTGELTLCIDAYSILFPDRRGHDFDVDEWDARKIWIYTTPTREGFRNLARIARLVVNGSVVTINGGSISLYGFRPNPTTIGA